MEGPQGEPPVERDELEVAIRTRLELTPEHEQEIIGGFLERVGHAIDARVDERMAQHEDDDDGYDGGAVPVAIGSIALGIPITAVAGNSAGLGGVIAAWIGIAAINVWYSLRWR